MSDTYSDTRGRLETYFDRTASETWARLTSDAPVSKIRQTVREGRDQMRVHQRLGPCPKRIGHMGLGIAVVRLAKRASTAVERKGPNRVHRPSPAARLL